MLVRPPEGTASKSTRPQTSRTTVSKSPATARKIPSPPTTPQRVKPRIAVSKLLCWAVRQTFLCDPGGCSNPPKSTGVAALDERSAQRPRTEQGDFQADASLAHRLPN